MKKQPRFQAWFTKPEQNEGQTSSLLLRPLQSKSKEPDSTQALSLNLLITLFLFGSVIGWVFEIILYLMNDGILVNPGYLHGPWTPIYGVCGMLIVMIFKDWDKSPVTLFILIAALCGTVELITGSFLELTTGAKWWDYSNLTFNLGGYVCLEALTLFGASGLLLIYVIAPSFERRLLRAPLRAQQIVFTVVLTMFFTDVLYSFHHPNLAVYIDVLSRL